MYQTIWSLGGCRSFGRVYLRALGRLAAGSGSEGLSEAEPVGLSGPGVPGTPIAPPSGRPKSPQYPARRKASGLLAGPCLLALLLVAFFTVCLCPPAWSQTTYYTWQRYDSDGNWNDPTNWNPSSGYPNSASDIAIFPMQTTDHRNVTLGANITVNQIQMTNTGTHRLEVGPSGTSYSITFAGTSPQIFSTAEVGGNAALRLHARVIVDNGLRKTGTGSAAFMNGLQGTGDVSFNGGTVEIHGNSTNFSGNLIVNSGATLQARQTYQYVLGNTTGKTIINQGGWFLFRDMGTSVTISEPFEIQGVHSRGSIQCFAGSVTMDGQVTLQANGSFSVRDWAPAEPGHTGNTRTFTINSIINDTGTGKNVYFLGDYQESFSRYPNARKNVIVLGAQNSYGGNTYITSNWHDASNPFTGNVRLGRDNALPTTTKVILGGRHDAGGGVYIGTTQTAPYDQGNGKLILNGYNQELAGLETAGTGTANRVVGGSSTTSTLTLNIADTVTNTYAGYLGGSDTDENNLALVKTGLGTLVLSGNNTYTGTTTVSQGVLKITHPNALGATGAGQGTTVADGARLELSGGITVNEPITIAGHGGWSGALRSTGSGNTWAGPITAEFGARIGTDDNTFTITGGITGSRVYLCGWGNGTIRIKDTPITLTGDFRVVDNTTGLIEVTGNSWTSTAISYGGILKLGVSDALPSSTVVTLGWDTTDGTFDLNGYSQTIGGLEDAGSGNRQVINSGAGASTLTINNTTNYTFAGVIQNHINLIKQGTGVQTLSGNNTYTGTTDVLRGTLALAKSDSNNNISGSSAIRVGSGATLNVTGLAGSLLRLATGQTLQGNGTVQGNVEAPAGSFLAAGMSPGHLTITGNYTQAGTLLVELAGYQQGGTQALPGQWQTNGYDWVSVGGSAVLDGYVNIQLLAGFQPASGDVFNVLTAAGGITDQGLDLLWQPGSLLPGQYWTYRIVAGQGGPNEQILQLQLGVPEPASGLLAGLALGALGLWLLRRRFGR
jgi:autotransporter-associated beta strand protein